MEWIGRNLLGSIFGLALSSPRMVFLQACFVEPGAKPIKSGRQWTRHGTALRRCQAPKGSDMIHSQICIYEIETISVPLSWSPGFQEISEERIATLCMAVFGLSASERCVLFFMDCSNLWCSGAVVALMTITYCTMQGGTDALYRIGTSKCGHKTGHSNTSG